MASKASKWKTLGSERIYGTPIFDLHRHRREHGQRGVRDFYVLSAPTWVNIIPLTAENEVVLVRQYRHGIEDFTIEIPGGMVDPEDESPLAAARREMIEECGYDSAEISELGRVNPNPAIQPNYCYSFLARNVQSVPQPEQTGAEETEVLRYRLAEVPELIRSGAISHALVIAAFSFLHLYNPPEH
ncbi:MAG TPA: NUDIX hydrolase [Candidatus Binataceae bacterium]